MTKQKKSKMKLIRTIAKGWSAIMIVLMGLFILAHFFSSGGEGTLPIKPVEIIAMIFFPIGVLVGMAVSWKWEKEGALMTIISVIVFFLLIMFPRGVGLRMFPTMFVIAGPSLLFLYASLADKKKR